MRLDPDPATCALGRQYNLQRQITLDLRNADDAIRQRAADTAEKAYLHELKDSGGVRITPDEPAACRGVLRIKEASELLAIPANDTVCDLAAAATSDGNDTNGMDDSQTALVKALLASRKFDQALPAAKTLFEICKLENTSKATDLLAEALLNGPGQKDPTIVDRFKSEQVAGAQTPAPGYSADSPAAVPPQTVLKSITIDPAPYEAKLQTLQDGPKTWASLTQIGNLLLMQDKGADAVPVFQQSESLTSDPKQLSAAIANVARAMRARDGCVGPANAYLLSLQTAQAKQN